MNTLEQESYQFYHEHAHRYAELVHDFFGDVYTDISHQNFKDDHDWLKYIQTLLPVNARVLDAGCGAGGREVYYYQQAGYEAYGIDVVKKNIETAKHFYPELSDYLAVADLSERLNYADENFDFVSCNVVIQHIQPEKLINVTLPEFCRILKPKGILQLMIKVGDGIGLVHDDEYNIERRFYLHQAEELLATLEKHGLSLIGEDEGHLGGVIYFTDPKPMRHALFWARKDG